MYKIKEAAAVVRALDHLIYVKALGSKESNHGVGLGTDGSALSNGIIGAFGYISVLVSKMGAEGWLFNKESVAISELLQFLEALSVFFLTLNINRAIPIVGGTLELRPREFHIPEILYTYETDTST